MPNVHGLSPNVVLVCASCFEPTICASRATSSLSLPVTQRRGLARVNTATNQQSCGSVERGANGMKGAWRVPVRVGQLVIMGLRAETRRRGLLRAEAEASGWKEYECQFYGKRFQFQDGLCTGERYHGTLLVKLLLVLSLACYAGE